MTVSTPLNFRKIAALVAGAGTLFWLYTFYFIAHVPPGDGTGFQWLAVFPLGMYVAGTYEMNLAMGFAILEAVPQIFLYIALAAWAATFIGFVHDLVRRAAAPRSVSTL